MQLTFIDWLIMLVYFVFVLGIGFALKRYMRTSNDFFLAGRSIPAWICGLAFISANLGAQEVIGMGASGAKYGIATSHFYWIGAIPAMVFVGIFMMPFYYGSKARSVPEFLRLRFDEKTRGLNAILFAVMTVFSSGISMYAMALLIQNLHMLDSLFLAAHIPLSWIFHVSIAISAVIVLAYIFLGGLTSAIYNEVLQFFLIVAGFLPLVWIGLKHVGGWNGIKHALGPAYTHSWRGMEHASTNPLGVEWFSLVMGLGFVLSFGYWCTDFLVIQRAMAADSEESARKVPLIAAIPKMFFPFLVILPGLIAISVPTVQAHLAGPAVAAGTNGAVAMEGRGLIPVKLNAITGEPEVDQNGKPVLNYDLAIPNMLLRYFPTGILGLGLTALLASFMSGMAGNVTAFNTVWTYDIYQSYIRKHETDEHYLWMGRVATVGGILLSIGAAYTVTNFNNIMDALQMVFAFVNAPLFATFLAGMFWKRATGHAAFSGLLAGVLTGLAHIGLTLPAGEGVSVKGGWLGVVHRYPSEMAQNFWTAIWAFVVCLIVTLVVSVLTKPREERELVGLVYSLTPKLEEHDLPWWKRPVTLAAVVLAMAVTLNLIFA
ncbi:MAG TPA: sodium:solute symporter family protein [Acidobacteriaceae bacterium]|nr:sodium:solute symporter family protein [Acidobacteriaceae bacterium]